MLNSDNRSYYPAQSQESVLEAETRTQRLVRFVRSFGELATIPVVEPIRVLGQAIRAHRNQG